MAERPVGLVQPDQPAGPWAGTPSLCKPDTVRSVLVFAVVRAESEEALEFFIRREDAERSSRKFAATSPNSRGY
jgi:hypothetical protein